MGYVRHGVKQDCGLFYTVTAPRATIRQCKLCKHFEKTPAGRPGVGRGYGMREGNKARGRMIQHIKEAHPTEYAAYMKKGD